MNFGRSPFWKKKKGHKKRPRTEFEKQVSRLDGYFSLYIRLSRMDADGVCTCFTCGNKKPWNMRKTAAGHFIPKAPNRFLRVRWDEQNVQTQCADCNSKLEGMQYQFGINLDKKYGTGTADKIQIKSTKSFNPMIFDMEKRISHYREKVNFIKKEHGIK